MQKKDEIFGRLVKVQNSERKGVQATEHIGEVQHVGSAQDEQDTDEGSER
jgi:hypothetical protein